MMDEKKARLEIPKEEFPREFRAVMPRANLALSNDPDKESLGQQFVEVSEENRWLNPEEGT